MAPLEVDLVALIRLRAEPILGRRERAQIDATVWHDGTFIARFERETVVREGHGG